MWIIFCLSRASIILRRSTKLEYNRIRFDGYIHRTFDSMRIESVICLKTLHGTMCYINPQGVTLEIDLFFTIYFIGLCPAFSSADRLGRFARCLFTEIKYKPSDSQPVTAWIYDICRTPNSRQQVVYFLFKTTDHVTRPPPQQIWHALIGQK